MKVNVEQINTVKRALTVEVPAAEVDKAIEKLFAKHGRKAKIKGFRAGKVPRAVLERYYGPQVAFEAAEVLVTEHTNPAIDEVGLSPLAQPEFDFDGPPQKGQDFAFKVLFDVRPQFDLTPESYKGFEIKEPNLVVGEEELNKRLDDLRARQAMLVPMEDDRPAQTGDVVVVDYQSFEGDEPVEGGAAENVDVELGAGQVREEIEVALVKVRPGDEVETTVRIEDKKDGADVAKDVRFKLVVKAIKKKLLPDLDDDFARSVSPQFETLDALRQRIRQDMEDAFAREKEMQVRRQILDHIRELGQFDLPESLVAQEVDNMVESFKSRLRQSGMDPDAVGLDAEKLASDFRPEAEKKVRAGIVLGRISEVENVDVTEEDFTAHYEKVSAQTGQPADVIKEIYNKNNMMGSVIAQLLEEKTLQAIKSGAIIKSVDPSELAQEMADDQAREHE